MNTVLNRKGAIEYTEKWYDSHNPDYVNYDEGEYQVDCTNFVSQCWHEGDGIDMSPLVWTGGSTTIVTTDAWVNVDAFAKYMTELSAGYDNLLLKAIKSYLKKDEWDLLIALVILNIPVTKLSKIYNVSIQAIYQKRKRIQQKIKNICS
jgi:hypothetical protein